MTLETEWPSLLVAGRPTTVGSGVTGAQPKHARVRILTLLISRLRLAAQALLQVQLLALHRHQRQVATRLAMHAQASGPTSAMVPATADGAGLQMILLSGILRTQNAGASDSL